MNTKLFIATAFLIMINASVFAKSIGPKSPDEPMLEKAPISKNDVTSLACYIKKGDKVK